MFSSKNQENHLRNLIGLILATAMLTSMFAVTSYSATGSSSSVAKTNRATSPPTQPQTPALKANGKIAFVSRRDGNDEIYVMNPDGSHQTNLTNNSADDYAPAWSPEGAKIAFVSNRNGNSQIFVMNADGSDPVQLTFDGFSYPGSLSWSPDGTRIAFSASQNQNFASDIYIINSDGSHLRRLTNATDDLDFSSDTSWSPDGTRIVFDRGFFSADLYVINADGSNVTMLATDGWSPDWSPDGAEIAFARSATPCYPLDPPFLPCLFEIFAINATGSNPRRLTTTPSPFSTANPAWSPDGARIAFEKEKIANDNSIITDEINVMNADGSNQTSLTNTGNNSSPAWQPVQTNPPPINPLDDAQFFVRQHYLDFLNREPDRDGLVFWTNEITSCGGDAQCIEVKRVNASAAFYLSIEFQQTGYLVYRIYKASYGNLSNTPLPLKLGEFLPDTKEIGQSVIVNQAGWEQVLENNKQAFAAEFVQRPRFTSAYPTSMTPAEFVDALFANAGVTPAETDRTAAVNEFGFVTTTTDLAARARALRRVAENSTLAQQEFNRAFVLMQYFGYLRRNPSDPPEPTLDFQGYNFWLNKLNQFNGDFVRAEMVKAFITSREYRSRFGS
jgi:Tol biopolymer transport system component